MAIPSPKLVTDPYSLIGYALALLFGLMTHLLHKNQKKHQWLIPACVVLAALCIVGGLVLAWRRETHSLPPQPELQEPSTQPQTQTIGPIHQDVTCGNAVAGVQGSVRNDGQPCQGQDTKRGTKQKGLSRK